ncbi:helix-turn-helix transcriptional regulator [Pseudomonas sp. P66]|uniref:Helix-turn-helix transcriptional regulator n=1 Tax=Pseudomonas arcuscaelestis TaxID=2710591 RepID=A0ABS2BZQ9_9PSED|nr:helix-turn-helix transcriptional regulator [Pseudomonas arcuscaelestis]MBM5459116.1 helix-turn-helix transcriptional regulator [Pseudomonas arcuscaelestis]
MNTLLGSVTSSEGTEAIEQCNLSSVQGLLLTSREQDVLACMLQALGCKQTARQLGIGEHTVRKHRGNLLRKYGASNAVELVALVLAATPHMVPSASDPVYWRWWLG